MYWGQKIDLAETKSKALMGSFKKCLTELKVF